MATALMLDLDDAVYDAELLKAPTRRLVTVQQIVSPDRPPAPSGDSVGVGPFETGRSGDGPRTGLKPCTADGRPAAQ